MRLIPTHTLRCSSNSLFIPSILHHHSYSILRHAAASYGHLNILEYLVSRGGDVNITDDDNDTPIYTVETEEVAKWLIDHGAIVDRLNNEGLSVCFSVDCALEPLYA